MSKRNLIWLGVVVAVLVAVGLTAGWLWGLLAAAVTLVASEVFERFARRKRLEAKGAAPVTPLRNAVKHKRS